MLGYDLDCSGALLLHLVQAEIACSAEKLDIQAARESIRAR